MARTKQTTRRSTGGKAPKKSVPQPPRKKRRVATQVEIKVSGGHGSLELRITGSYWHQTGALAKIKEQLAEMEKRALAAYEESMRQLQADDDADAIQARLDQWQQTQAGVSLICSGGECAQAQD